jgi:4-hydroxy-4-methyl-2-oxoglutarate aldolase
MEQANPGEVLVIDNGGRLEEACIGDIVVLEAKAAGLTGIFVWGLHRDSKELHEIGFPVFSIGALPTGPQRLHARPPDVFSSATIGNHTVTSNDYIVADANGAIFLPEDRLQSIIEEAAAYRATEARQLKAMSEGKNYRAQTRIHEYIQKRWENPAYNFRQHLKDIAAAGEA